MRTAYNDHLGCRGDSLQPLFSLLCGCAVLLRTQTQSLTAACAAGVDPSSPLGLFLRQCRVAFLRLPFEGVVHLLTELQRALHAATNGPADGAERDRGDGGSAVLPAGSLRERPAVEAFLNRQLRHVEMQVCA